MVEEDADEAGGISSEVRELVKKKKYQDALELVKDAERRQSVSPEWVVKRLLYVYLCARRYRELFGIAEGALGRSPRADPGIYFWMAQAHESQHEFKRAVECYQAAIASEVRTAQSMWTSTCVLQVAALSLMLDDPETTLEMLRRMPSKEPKTVWAGGRVHSTKDMEIEARRRLIKSVK